METSLNNMAESELTKIVRFWNEEESYFNHPTARKGQIVNSTKEYIEQFPFYDLESIKEVTVTKNGILFIFLKDNKELYSAKVFKDCSELELDENHLYKVLEDDDIYTLISVSGCINSYLELQRTRYGK